MCHVAAEMERQGFDLPLLIGGATTSRVHTAVKIHPNYRRGQTVYVTDASRAVGVAQALMWRDKPRDICRRDARTNMPASPPRMRAAQEDKQRLSLDGCARQRAQARLGELRAAGAELPRHAGCSTTIRSPSWSTTSTGRRSSRPGSWPANSRRSSTTRRSARRRARCSTMRRRCSTRSSTKRWFKRRGRASASGRRIPMGDDIVVFADEARGKPIATLHTLRQQLVAARRPRQRGARRFRRAARRIADYIGAFVVTAGHRRGRGRRPLQARQRRLFVDHGQGAGRPPGRSFRRAAAPARAQGVLGLRGRRDA